MLDHAEGSSMNPHRPYNRAPRREVRPSAVKVGGATVPIPVFPARSRPNSAIVWTGPSLINGEPIAIVVSGLVKASENGKTDGSMLQTWILPLSMRPDRAVARGRDVSVCGTCQHRSEASGGQGTCYVQVPRAPLSVWRAMIGARLFAAQARGRAPTIWRAGMALAGEALQRGRGLRIGSYGDPGATPSDIWQTLDGWRTDGATRTGYTHRWRERPDLRSLCMASVDTYAEAVEAESLGWRYFLASDGEAPEGAVQCPASEEAGKVSTCGRCGLCSGSTVARGRHRGSVNLARSAFIRLHGLNVKIKRARARKLAREAGVGR